MIPSYPSRLLSDSSLDVDPQEFATPPRNPVPRSRPNHSQQGRPRYPPQAPSFDQYGGRAYDENVNGDDVNWTGNFSFHLFSSDILTSLVKMNHRCHRLPRQSSPPLIQKTSSRESVLILSKKNWPPCPPKCNNTSGRDYSNETGPQCRLRNQRMT